MCLLGDLSWIGAVCSSTQLCSAMNLIHCITLVFPYGPVRSPMDLYVPLWTCTFPCPHHIRVSYVPLQLALKYHPDKNPGAEEQVNTYMHIPLCVITPSSGVKHYFYYHSHTCTPSPHTFTHTGTPSPHTLTNVLIGLLYFLPNDVIF